MLSNKGANPNLAALKRQLVPQNQWVQEMQVLSSPVTDLGDAKSKRKLCLISHVLETVRQAKQISQVVSD